MVDIKKQKSPIYFIKEKIFEQKEKWISEWVSFLGQIKNWEKANNIGYWWRNGCKQKDKKLKVGFVDREATHSYRKDFEKIFPNPDISDKQPMYLNRLTKKPKRLFEPYNKKLIMPKHLKDRYDKNNHK